MKILIDIGHPAHVHFYRNAINELRKKGHKIFISARRKDVTCDLLDFYDLPYEILSHPGTGKLSIYQEFLQREAALLHLLRDFKPDIVTEIGGIFIAPVCKLLRIPSVVFTDSEHVKIDRLITHHLANLIVTPDCYLNNINGHHIRYPGFHELAYLHPKYFNPDRSVLKEIGINDKEPYIVLRFVAWNASHDRGQSGFSESFKPEIIKQLSQFGRVLISSENQLPNEFKPFEIKLPSYKIHHLLAFAQLYLGEGATMATESAILGTPSIYMSSLVGSMGNFEELFNRYKLVYSFKNQNDALQFALEMLQTQDNKHFWKIRSEQLIKDKIDVTQLICSILENYPKYEKLYQPLVQ